eukprot:scaffold2621_cov344-Prasinococcus_capsulatus_cf.AAC.2
MAPTRAHGRARRCPAGRRCRSESSSIRSMGRSLNSSSSSKPVGQIQGRVRFLSGTGART